MTRIGSMDSSGGGVQKRIGSRSQLQHHHHNNYYEEEESWESAGGGGASDSTEYSSEDDLSEGYGANVLARALGYGSKREFKC